MDPGRAFSILCFSEGEFSGPVSWKWNNGIPVQSIGICKQNNLLRHSNAHFISTHSTDYIEQHSISLGSLTRLYQSTFSEELINRTTYFAELVTLKDFGVEPDSSGLYTCTANNGLTTSNNHKSITINGKELVY